MERCKLQFYPSLRKLGIFLGHEWKWRAGCDLRGSESVGVSGAGCWVVGLVGGWLQWAKRNRLWRLRTVGMMTRRCSSSDLLHRHQGYGGLSDWGSYPGEHHCWTSDPQTRALDQNAVDLDYSALAHKKNDRIRTGTARGKWNCVTCTVLLAAYLFARLDGTTPMWWGLGLRCGRPLLGSCASNWGGSRTTAGATGITSLRVVHWQERTQKTTDL